MAIFTPGPAISEIRGSQGGTTFSRNRHGQYTRQRSVPVNPNSERQVLARDRFNTLATRWRDTLTSDQRAAWETYANNTNWMNGVGEVTHLTGLNQYVRTNVLATIGGQAARDDAPVVFGLPDQEELWSISGDSATGDMTITYTFDTDVDDQVYFFFMGQPVDASHNFFAGPWRRLAIVYGDSGSPPASPKVVAAPYAIGAGQKVFAYCRRLDADGRLTEPFREDCVVT